MSHFRDEKAEIERGRPTPKLPEPAAHVPQASHFLSLSGLVSSLCQHRMPPGHPALRARAGDLCSFPQNTPSVQKADRKFWFFN